MYATLPWLLDDKIADSGLLIQSPSVIDSLYRIQASSTTTAVAAALAAQAGDAPCNSQPGRQGPQINRQQRMIRKAFDSPSER